MTVNQVVWKHTTAIGATVKIYFPPTARVTMVRVDPDNAEQVQFWVAHPEPSELDPDEYRDYLTTFEVVGTGQPFTLDWEVVGSCADPDHPLIWHLVRHD